MNLYRHELKNNFKSFIIWLLCVGAMCFGCILLYSSIEGSMGDMGEMFAEMGVMSQAFGMDRLSISTLTGYFATEIAMIHALGGAMFAAILGSNLLSKEEHGHTIEFLAVLPIKREKIVTYKYFAMLTYLLAFQVICALCYAGGFALMGEEVPFEKMGVLSATQLLLLVEVGSICFCISAFSRKNMLGTGLGVSLLFFTADIMCRIIPAIKSIKYITPFYYCNATDIFTDTNTPAACYILGVVFTLLAVAAAFGKYLRKDFSA